MKIKNLLLICVAIACGHQRHTTEFPYAPSFSKIDVMGQSKDPQLNEVSGLAKSISNSGLFWTHNDSGDKPRVFLINPAGEIKLTVTISNAKNIDWEDIALGELNGTNMLFIGDIGDNRAERDQLFIYAFEEPVLDSLKSGEVALAAEKMEITYVNGARDAETLLFDHFSKELVIVSKRDPEVMVYPFRFQDGSSESVSFVSSLQVTQLTAGDMSTNGDLLLKNYNEIYLIKNPSKKALRGLLTSPEILRVKYREEKQGEAICWDEKGEGFYVLSEWNDNEPQPFYYYHN